MVVPLIEPPVATLGLPFIIFFFRSNRGSNQLARAAVAEKGLTLWKIGYALGRQAAARPVCREGLVAEVVAIVKLLKAPARELLEAIVVAASWGGMKLLSQYTMASD
jgi:hypothetical protein